MADKALKVNTSTGDVERTADLVESSEVNTTPNANQIPRADGSGDIDAGWIGDNSLPLGALAQSGATDGQVATYNNSTGDWEPTTISGSAVTVRDIDGTPSISATTIEFTNGSVTDQGGGVARVATGGGSAVEIDQGTYSGLPTGSEDDLYFATDVPYALRKGASAWQAFAPLWAVTEPPSTGWSWDNQGSATATHNGTLILESDINLGVEANVYYRAAPSTPYTITAFVAIDHPALNADAGGIAFRESTTGALVTLIWEDDTIRVQKWTNATTFSSTVSNTSFNIPLNGFWLRIADDGINRTASVSQSGSGYIDLYTEARTTFLTADQVAAVAFSRDATYPVFLTVMGWDVT
jgi:hypothetical protein